VIRILILLAALAGAALGQETASVARLRRQCVVSPRLRADVGAYQITWGTVRFERFTRIGTDEYYTQLCYPKLWMGKPADSARRSGALYAGVWKVTKGKKLATLEHFIFQDQGKVTAPHQLRSPIGQVWYLPAPCICASKMNLDAYFLVRDRQLRRIDTDSWERSLTLPEGTAKGGPPVLDLVAMEGHLQVLRANQPAGAVRAKLRLDGLKLAVDQSEVMP
jgi:hypothetical protein